MNFSFQKFFRGFAKIMSVIIYFLLIGTLIVDTFDHKTLDILNYKWWSLFLLLEIWFATVVEKRLGEKNSK